MIDLATAIRSPWAEWDSDQYADAMRETYQAVDVTTLELSGRQGADDELVRLKDISIAQDAWRGMSAFVFRKAWERKSVNLSPYRIGLTSMPGGCRF